ncbi:hypothetical protein [Bacillus sp. NPDC094106]|uniref:hypothetical protein n=1 Tax=Bacillus sp. NPDC094106 TaxID=3363949 RepID=UPI00380E6DA0
MDEKHGLSQERINLAKEYAQRISEMVAKVDMLFYLSDVGHIEEKKAELGIKNLTDVIKQDTEKLLANIEKHNDV